MLTGPQLKAIRALRGINQSDLAAEAGCSKNAVAEFETGKRDLRMDTLRRICEALDVVVTYRVDGSEISGS